jgi:hypothetical protein
MAVASQWLAARYNRDGFTLFDFDVTRRPATEQAYVPDPWG